MTSKLSPRRIKFYIADYIESTKILQLYDYPRHKIYTSRDVVFFKSSKYLESTKVESLTNGSLDLDSDAH
jgi:hypothetical protein